MSAVLASLVQYIVKVLIFAAVAWAGITCGKKFRDKKDAAKNLVRKEERNLCDGS